VYFSLDTIPATVLWHDKGNGCYQRTNNPIINYKEADSVYFVFESNYDKLSERVDNSFRMIHIVDGGESFETLSAYIAQNYYPGAYPPGSYLFIRTVGGMGDPGYVSFSDQPTFTYYSKIEDGVGRTYTITPVHTGEAVGEGRVVRYEEAPPSFFKIHGIDEQFFSMYVPLKECQAAWQWSAPTRIENCHI